MANTSVKYSHSHIVLRRFSSHYFCEFNQQDRLTEYDAYAGMQ